MCAIGLHLQISCLLTHANYHGSNFDHKKLIWLVYQSLWKPFFSKFISYTMLLWYRKIQNNVECQQISMGQPSSTIQCSDDILWWVDLTTRVSQHLPMGGGDLKPSLLDWYVNECVVPIINITNNINELPMGKEFVIPFKYRYLVGSSQGERIFAYP